MEIIKISINSDSNFIFFVNSVNMNDVHDVQYLRNLLQNSQFITDITALKTSLVYFERLSRKKYQKIREK